MPKRRIIKAMPKFISLCERGANNLTTMFKSDGDSFELQTLVKADMDKGELLAVVYAPEVRDLQGDVASADVIKKAMEHAAKHGTQIDIRHNEKPVPTDSAYIAESFIVQKSDERFHDWKDYEGNPVDVTDAWAVRMQIDDPDLRKAYREGDWNGVSMGGSMLVEQEKSSEDESGGLVSLLNRVIAKLVPNGDDDMSNVKIDDIKKAITDSNETLAEKIVSGVVGGIAKIMGKEAPDDNKTDPEKGETPDAGPPEFKGDPNKLADVKAHKAALDAYNARTSIDWNDPEAVNAHLAKIDPDKEELRKEAGVTAEDSDEVRKLKLAKYAAEQELARINKASNQGGNDFNLNGSNNGSAEATGARMAKHINRNLGTHRDDSVINIQIPRTALN